VEAGGFFDEVGVERLTLVDLPVQKVALS